MYATHLQVPDASGDKAALPGVFLDSPANALLTLQEAAPELQDDELGDAPGAITAVAAAAGSSEKTASAAAPQGDSSTAVLHNSHADRPAAAAPGAEAAAAGVAESAEPQQSAAAAVVPKSANKVLNSSGALGIETLAREISTPAGVDVRLKCVGFCVRSAL
jgi:hypothetical protein